MKIPFGVEGTLNNDTVVTLETAEATDADIYVTKITLSITTHANAKFVAVQDSNGSPKVIAKHNDLTAAAGVPSKVHWDFGKRGIKCTTGKNLTCVSEGSGVAGLVYAEGYQITNS